MRRLVLALVLLLAGPALAQGFTTREIGRDGDLIGVAALLPMDGADFLSAWNTPRETPDDLPEMSVATAGQVVSFVLFAAGMGLNDQHATLDCHVAFLTRDGEGQVVQDGPCLTTPVEGDGTAIQPAYLFDFRIPDSFAGEIVAIGARLTDRGTGSSVAMRLAMPVVAAGEAGE
ncbi:MAG: hypothetical protein H6900_13720 [Rhodobacter sp.]|uniref:hypothetical protein n=1 Tax=Pararhodobacter sp. TaxID=2127056 RepID=UPI001D746C45|nr:hypothetical protein [Pararhodobacter sp.]MCB1343776.1 hypothetical protein [Paracoccaceae bacterium]MCB1409185.1 hypothetical protein [Paracoccaceae bacterium]MCC0074337.1 hypothetical protein [Rhodobacter sp.]HPD93503.1 hypothetical protein [Pararhodobacter sp.]